MEISHPTSLPGRQAGGRSNEQRQLEGVSVVTLRLVPAG
ncbi:hypothetical protein I547_7131 [Mycobacterium kansasii 824]|uniref:Uncharacterized protein n=1 Tax=Mycobacterium kansasii TaxID=1768 RepID=A0A1V3WD03_MYCKA|nr:hypothetical protein I547_7131 [Mycobacterium kansasii 824]OOK64825.1 hypothetical protein BZL29_8164 [Mycobacterium kansasii]OOK74260.1 hypothetical protein BZL30_4537 [Mycobacterium kansasii]